MALNMPSDRVYHYIHVMPQALRLAWYAKCSLVLHKFTMTTTNLAWDCSVKTLHSKSWTKTWASTHSSSVAYPFQVQINSKLGQERLQKILTPLQNTPTLSHFWGEGVLHVYPTVDLKYDRKSTCSTVKATVFVQVYKTGLIFHTNIAWKLMAHFFETPSYSKKFLFKRILWVLFPHFRQTEEMFQGKKNATYDTEHKE